ncbi:MULTISPECIES: hypothetical protein [Okeania]|nr:MULTISPECIES: hypothetical protein [unclassified Okeania]
MLQILVLLLPLISCQFFVVDMDIDVPLGASVSKLSCLFKDSN